MKEALKNKINEILIVPLNKEVLIKQKEPQQKDTRANLKELPMAKAGIICAKNK